MSQLPKTVCPKTMRRDCPICGRWIGWVDLSNPGRSPTQAEWRSACLSMQAEHDKLRERQFNDMRLEASK